MGVLLLLALVVRLWGLRQNGWGAEYYTAAVRSMSLNWHNFFFAAFDPQGFISVDKPPVALWLQVLSVKLLGFHPLAVLLPQVLEGVCAVWLLHHLVRRRFSAGAALLAAFLFALSPVWVAVNRTNNIDSCLVMVLMLAGWALLKAAEEGSRRLLLGCAALVGLAFNVKMLAAFMVLPAFALVYVGADLRVWRRRLVDLGLAGLVLLAVALPWVATYQVVSTGRRPYVGGSRNNSMVDLVLGHNALSRFVRVRPEGAQAITRRLPSPGTRGGQLNLEGPETLAHLVNLNKRLYATSPVGPLRLFSGQFAAQTAWLLPLAVAGLILGLRRRRPVPAAPDPRTVSLGFWLAWTAIFWIVYSSLGGIVHFYYLATLAPALAALAGIGAASLWERHRERAALAAPAVLVLTLLWQLHIECSGLGWHLAALRAQPERWLGWLHTGTVLGALLGSAGGLTAASYKPRLARGFLALGLAALMVLPTAWALSSVLLPGKGIVPCPDLKRLITAGRDPEAFRLANFGRTADTSRLVPFLLANRQGERFLLAASTYEYAAPIIIQTGEAALARGGYHGLDGAVGPEQMAALVQTGQVRFALVDDVSPISRLLGGELAGRPVAHWIRSYGQLVDPGLWRGPGVARHEQLYDLCPGKGLRVNAPF